MGGGWVARWMVGVDGWMVNRWMDGVWQGHRWVSRQVDGSVSGWRNGQEKGRKLVVGV